MFICPRDKLQSKSILSPSNMKVYANTPQRFLCEVLGLYRVHFMKPNIHISEGKGVDCKASFTS